MFLSFASAGRNTVRGAGSRFALALALAGGAIVTSAAIAPSAYAQNNARAQGNSRGFVAAYTPLDALVKAEMPNWAAAGAQFETLVAAIENEDDRNIAGNLALQIGTNTNNPAMQRRGLEMMLQSGKVAPEQIGQFQYYVGTLAFQARDYAAARTALLAAVAAGYTENEPQGLILQTYLDEGNLTGGIDYLGTLATSGQAGENLYLRVLQKSYDGRLAPESLRATTMLVKAYPTQENWKKGLQVVNDLAELDEQGQLDALRLMRATGAMSQRAEYVRYIENADPRIMGNEVLGVLAEGLASGELTTDDYYTEVKGIADTRAPQDRADLEATVREGQSGAAIDASVAGDVLYSVGDYARAETMYLLAAEKGGDKNVAFTRAGMAQVQQNKYAEAIATLGQVTGPRQPIAALWATWAEQKMAG